jgi:SAM-dependent methyltransferase
MPFSQPLEPHGRALRDYFAGAAGAVLTLYSNLGERDELPVNVFFRGPADFFPFERAALALCRGRVLDVGAGTGVHALYLQDRGQDVRAIDVLPEAVEIMKARGVRDARLARVQEIEGETYDTVLMLMNGIGILGTLDGLDRFLRGAHQLLEPSGQILLDSGPANLVGDSTMAAMALEVDEGSYPGEAWIELEYEGERGPPFRELYADSETLCQHARDAGWDCDIVFRDEHGGYVARLTRTASEAISTPK